MTPELRHEILTANIEAHDREAVVYERAVPEIFNKKEQARIRRLVVQATDLLPQTNRRALDIGCGTGTVTLKLLDHGFTVDALDISRAMLDELSARLGDRKNRVNLIQNDIDTFLERPADPYDLVTMSSVLHHLPDYEATLRKIVDRVRPDGVILIVHEPVGVEGHWLLRRFLWLDAVLYNLLFLPFRDQRIVFGIDYKMVDYQVGNGFRVDTVLDALKGTGCAIIHDERYSALKFRITSWFLDHLTPVRLQFACLAQKQITPQITNKNC